MHRNNETTEVRAQRDVNLLIEAIKKGPEGLLHSTFGAIQRQVRMREIIDLPPKEIVTHLFSKFEADKIAVARAVVATIDPNAPFRKFNYRNVPNFDLMQEQISIDPELSTKSPSDLYGFAIRYKRWPLRALNLIQLVEPNFTELPQTPHAPAINSDKNLKKPKAIRTIKETPKPKESDSSGPAPSDKEIAVSILRLLAAGIAPNAPFIAMIASKEGSEPLTTHRIGTVIPRLINNLSPEGFVTDLWNPEKGWPADMPIQTMDDFLEFLRFYKENNRRPAAQRLPVQVGEWMDSHQDLTAFPEIRKEIVSKTNLKDSELVESDLVIADKLLQLPDRYLYSKPDDMIPDIQNHPVFKGMAPRWIRSYITSTVYEAPRRYAIAAEVRDLAFKNGAPDPTENMRLGKFFKMLAETEIAPGHTLEGISERNLFLLFLRISPPFEEMRRRIIMENQK